MPLIPEPKLAIPYGLTQMILPQMRCSIHFRLEEGDSTAYRPQAWGKLGN